MKCSLTAAASAKSFQTCLTLCNPIDSSPPGSAVPGILQARTLEWVAISFSDAWKWKVKGKLLSCVQLLATPWTEPTRLLHPWDFPGKSTGVGCHCLLQCSLVISNFLEKVSSLSHSVIFLYFRALIAEEGFLISPCYSLELCIQMLLSFLFSFAFHFSSFHSYL